LSPDKGFPIETAHLYKLLKALLHGEDAAFGIAGMSAIGDAQVITFFIEVFFNVKKTVE
jgi:hypothetical protein